MFGLVPGNDPGLFNDRPDAIRITGKNGLCPDHIHPAKELHRTDQVAGIWTNIISKQQQNPMDLPSLGIFQFLDLVIQFNDLGRFNKSGFPGSRFIMHYPMNPSFHG